MVTHLMTRYGLERETVFVQTLASSEAFYAGLGFEAMDAAVVDLAEWAGEGRGFGSHRAPQMIRQPAEWKGSIYSGRWEKVGGAVIKD